MELNKQQKRTLNQTWHNMKYRRLHKETASYVNYGGRGIKICQRWLDSFENFCVDMGPKPSKEYSLDRINNDENYEPSNCKWSTQKEQMLNTRRAYSGIKIIRESSNNNNQINPKCPACSSLNIITNRSGERWCRRCGQAWKK